MSVVHDVFEKPLRQSKLVSEKDIEAIFVNWRDIIRCNSNFLNDLIDNYNESDGKVGHIICRHVSLTSNSLISDNYRFKI